MDVGELDTRIVIESRDPNNQDQAGQVIDVWTKVCSTWGKVHISSGHESLKYDADMSITKGYIRIRKRPNIDASMRIRIKSNVFKITAIPYSNRGWYMDIFVEAINGI